MDELKNVKSDGSFIPEGCLSFVEASSYALAAIDEDFDELMESTGLLEQDQDTEDTEGNGDDVATSEAAVLTEASAKEIGGKVVEFLKGIWQKIQDAFKAVVQWLKDRIMDVKKKGAEKMLDKIDKADFKSDKVLGSYHIAANIDDVKWMGVLEMKTMGFDDDPQDLPSQIIDAMSVGTKLPKRADVKTLRDMMREAFLGEATEVKASSLAKDKGNLIKILTGKSMDVVKKAYNQSRKTINDMIAKFKSQKKELGKDDKENKKQLAGAINYGRRCGQLLYTGVCIQFDCIRKQFNEAFSIAMRVSLHKDKKEKKEKEKTNEAANIFAW